MKDIALKNEYLFVANERRRIYVDRKGKDSMTLTVEWRSPSVSPAGILTFSIDGDPGENNVKDLSEPGRVWVTNGRPPFFDLDVSGLPPAGCFALYIW